MITLKFEEEYLISFARALGYAVAYLEATADEVDAPLTKRRLLETVAKLDEGANEIIEQVES